MVSDIKAKRKESPILKKIVITTICKIDKQGPTGNYIQYLITTYDGKESGKVYKYIYLYRYVYI